MWSKLFILIGANVGCPERGEGRSMTTPRMNRSLTGVGLVVWSESDEVLMRSCFSCLLMCSFRQSAIDGSDSPG